MKQPMRLGGSALPVVREPVGLENDDEFASDFPEAYPAARPPIPAFAKASRASFSTATSLAPENHSPARQLVRPVDVARWVAMGMLAGLVTTGLVSGIGRLGAPPHSSTARANRGVVSPARATPLRSPESELRAVAPAVSIQQPVVESAKPVSPSLEDVPVKLPPVTAPRAIEKPAVRPTQPLSATRLPAAPMRAPDPIKVSWARAVPVDPSLVREVAVLDKARAAMRDGNMSGARQALAQYEEAPERGIMRAEAMYLRMESLARSGQHLLAVEIARNLLRQYPESAQAARARELVLARLQ